MEKVYNKLVRDNIPKIINEDGCNSVIRVLNDQEYKTELEKKLLEEYNEVLGTITTEERIEELADMLEIIQALAILENKTLDDIVEIAKIKRLKRGGFEKKIFLEKVINIDGK